MSISNIFDELDLLQQSSAGGDGHGSGVSLPIGASEVAYVSEASVLLAERVQMKLKQNIGIKIGPSSMEPGKNMQPIMTHIIQSKIDAPKYWKTQSKGSTGLSSSAGIKKKMLGQNKSKAFKSSPKVISKAKRKKQERAENYSSRQTKKLSKK